MFSTTCWPALTAPCGECGLDGGSGGSYLRGDQPGGFLPTGLSCISTTWRRTTSLASCPSPRSCVLLVWVGAAVGWGHGERWGTPVCPVRKIALCANGSFCSLQTEEKQKATQQFNKLQAAMKVMGISSDEQKAFWLVLGAIYHLGAAGATKGNKLLGAGMC